MLNAHCRGLLMAIWLANDGVLGHLWENFFSSIFQLLHGQPKCHERQDVRSPGSRRLAGMATTYVEATRAQCSNFYLLLNNSWSGGYIY